MLAVCHLLAGCHLRSIQGSIGTEKKRLKEAETAFFQKDYTRAGLKFQEIYNRSRDPELKNAASYGLICTNLMTAEERRAVHGALTSLNRWNPLDRDGPHVENPQLMVRVLEKLIWESWAKDGRNSLKMKRMIRTHQEDMEKMKSVRKGLQDKIFRLEAGMETLRHQISELETIDQEIQEKRKPL